MIVDDYIHIQYAKICIIMNYNRKSVDTKYTIFLVLVVALVVDYSLKLRDIHMFRVQQFQRRRSLERTPELQPQQSCTSETASLSWVGGMSRRR